MDRVRVPNRLVFSKKRLPVGVILSYVFDYVIIIVLAVLYSLLDKIVTPFHQPFALQNYTIKYPYAVHERITIAHALMISAAFPILVIIVYTLIIDGIFSSKRKMQGWKGVYRFKDRLWELNCGILGLLLAQGAAFVITGSLKNLIGKPRPDFIDRCQPSPDSADPRFGLSNNSICTRQDAYIMQDAYRSFPSGHSSSSFAGLFYLSLYLAGKLHVLDNRGEVWRTVVVLIPTLAAACVAASRIMDARHHPFDVLFGSALGILVGWAAYRQYFPPVSHSWLKGRAYPIRTWGKQTKMPPEQQSGVGMEPYRTAAAIPQDMRDEEQVHQSSGNVFRDQISRSQRQRERAHLPADFQTGSTNPYVHPRSDDLSPSSSEDDMRRDGEFEMHRPEYTLTDPEGRSAPVSQPRGDRDTEYRSQVVAQPKIIPT